MPSIAVAAASAVTPQHFLNQDLALCYLGVTVVIKSAQAGYVNVGSARSRRIPGELWSAGYKPLVQSEETLAS